MQLHEVCGDPKTRSPLERGHAGIASRNLSILANLGRNGPFPAWTSNLGISPGRGERGWSSERAQGMNSLWDVILFPSSLQLNVALPPLIRPQKTLGG